ncbi:hypothetical protein [Acinetobacter sp. A47]|uniref:hypothetical protein n=1 Tax=Acinetobacter sp. A47 TaxID=1561217 RepID=UPI0005710B79|nr:hypothetical protein [Acinetobacter sp. A47]
MASLTMWDDSGNIIYENPKFLRPVDVVNFTSYSGQAVIQKTGASKFIVIGFGQVNKKVGNRDNWVGGGILFINNMCQVHDGVIQWNIQNDGNLMFGGWKGPFDRGVYGVRGKLYVFAR